MTPENAARALRSASGVRRRRVSPFRAGFGCRCPGCGEGRLYAGFLKVAEACGRCGLDLRDHDAEDGPVVFVILAAAVLAAEIE